MIPRLADKYEIEIVTISHPNDHFTTEEYRRSGQPAAPAIKVGDEVVVEKADINEKKLEAFICKHLGLPLPEIWIKRFFKIFRI